jgi:Ala-tRNA(Pro) deacylase
MKFAEYLSKQGIRYETHDHVPAYTAQEVAAEEHISGNRFAKTVVVRADEKFILCVLPASCKLDMEKVSKALRAKKVRLADEQEMATLFPDSEVGAEPPFGSLYQLPTLVDTHFVSAGEIAFQAGTHRQAIRMSYTDYAKLAQPIVTDLAVHL